MSEKLKSEGKCFFCGELKTQRSINQHLKKHLQQPENITDAKKGKSFLIYARAEEMFISLWADEKLTFDDLDHYLRGIWLECCGHLSAFRVKGGYYVHKPSKQDLEWGIERDEEEVPMNFKLGKVLQEGKKLDYEYDFGTTTDFQIEVKAEFDIAPKEGIILLSRNEPLAIMCHSCQKKPAQEICSVHVWDGSSMFCPACAKKHAKTCEDFADYANMPVVNSPRMGMCAYEGGRIDKERDGVYQGK